MVSWPNGQLNATPNTNWRRGSIHLVAFRSAKRRRSRSERGQSWLVPP